MGKLQLTQEQFEQIVGSENLRFDPAASDRRQAVRVGLSAEVPVLPFRDNKQAGPPFTVRLRDVSHTGIGFLHTREIHVGEELALRLPRHHGKPVWFYCRVIRWQPVRDDLFVIGATFERLLEVPEKG